MLLTASSCLPACRCARTIASTKSSVSCSHAQPRNKNKLFDLLWQKFWWGCQHSTARHVTCNPYVYLQTGRCWFNFTTVSEIWPERGDTCNSEGKDAVFPRPFSRRSLILLSQCTVREPSLPDVYLSMTNSWGQKSVNAHHFRCVQSCLKKLSYIRRCHAQSMVCDFQRDLVWTNTDNTSDRLSERLKNEGNMSKAGTNTCFGIWHNMCTAYTT